MSPDIELTCNDPSVTKVTVYVFREIIGLPDLLDVQVDAVDQEVRHLEQSEIKGYFFKNNLQLDPAWSFFQSRHKNCLNNW